MPQRKVKHRKKARSSKKDTSLWIYILLGLVCIFLIYVIIKTPEGTKDIIKIFQKDKAKELKETPKADQAPITDKNGQPLTSLDTALLKAASMLSVPSDEIKKKTDGSSVKYKLPLNRSMIDLVYANMIVKGQAELVGAKLTKGKETSGKQTLEFNQEGNPKNYVVELYFDSDVYPKVATGKVIAIVVDDFGTISGDLLEGFLTLNNKLTFAILPNQKYSEYTMNQAYAKGIETIIHVPMEPLGYPSQDPGKDAILVQQSTQEIENRIERFIKELPLCKGINNHMGSLATTEPEVMQAVMRSLKKHNMYFLDSRTSNVSIAYQTAQKSLVPAFQNQLFLDSPDISDKTMKAKYDQILSLSERGPYVIAITHCHNKAKLEYLERMLDMLTDAGFTIQPISKLMNRALPGII